MVTQTLQTTRRVSTEEDSPRTYKREKTIYRTYQAIWFFVGFIEILLAFRFLFEALGANAYSGFTSFIYGVSYPFALPFRGIFSITYTQYSFIDWTLLVAGIVYAVVGWGLVAFLRFIKPVTHEEMKETINSSV